MKNKEKQLKNKEKQVEALEVLKPEKNKEEIKSVEELFPKGMRINEIKNEMDKIKKWEWDLVYKANKYKYETIRSFGDSIYNGKISVDEVEIDQSSLLDGLADFNDRSRPKTAEGKNKKRNTYKSAYAFYEG